MRGQKYLSDGSRATRLVISNLDDIQLGVGREVEDEAGSKGPVTISVMDMARLLVGPVVFSLNVTGSCHHVGMCQVDTRVQDGNLGRGEAATTRSDEFVVNLGVLSFPGCVSPAAVTSRV